MGWFSSKDEVDNSPVASADRLATMRRHEAELGKLADDLNARADGQGWPRSAVTRWRAGQAAEAAGRCPTGACAPGDYCECA